MTEIHLEFSLPSVEKLVTCQQVHVTSKKHITSLGRHLSPWNSCVFPSGDTLLDSCHLTTTWMCNIRLQAPTLTWKCEISHWFPCGVDRQTIELMHGHTKFHFVITIISLFFFRNQSITCAYVFKISACGVLAAILRCSHLMDHQAQPTVKPLVLQGQRYI